MKLSGRSVNHLMVFLVMIFGMWAIFYGERIPRSDGLGWDGEIYAQIAREFPAVMDTLSTYRMQRILPSVAVHVSLWILRLPIDNSNIINAYIVFNLSLLVMVAYLWGVLADDFRLGIKGKWIGFICLFVNYANMNYPFYYPVLTDTWAFAEGMLMLFFFFRGYRSGLLLVTIAGAFTWPTLLYCGLILFVFPCGKLEHAPARNSLHSVLAGVVTLSFLQLIIHYCYGELPSNRTVDYIELRPPIRIFIPVIHLSTIAAITYIFLMARAIFNWGALYDLKALRGLEWKGLAIRSAIALSIIAFSSMALSTDVPPAPTTTGLLRKLIWISVGFPLIFGVSHVVWFGPAAYLTLFFWNRISAKVNECGPGLFGYCLCALALTLNSESRVLINFLPLAGIFAALVADDLDVKPSTIWILAGIGILSSKTWLSANHNFPALYLLNFGPWMTSFWYAVQGSIVAICGVALFFLVRMRSSEPSMTTDDDTRSLMDVQL